MVEGTEKESRPKSWGGDTYKVHDNQELNFNGFEKHVRENINFIYSFQTGINKKNN